MHEARSDDPCGISDSSLAFVAALKRAGGTGARRNDRRDTRVLLGLMFTVGLENERVTDFIVKTAEMDFLFGAEIRVYHNEILARARRLISARDGLKAS